MTLRDRLAAALNESLRMTGSAGLQGANAVLDLLQPLLDAVEELGADEWAQPLRNFAKYNHDCELGTGKNVPSYHTCTGCAFLNLADEFDTLAKVRAALEEKP